MDLLFGFWDTEVLPLETGLSLIGSGALLIFLIVLTVLNRRIIFIVFKTLPRDISAIYRFAKTMITIKKYDNETFSVPQIFDQTVEKYPGRVFFATENHEWTFREMWTLSNKVANYFQSKGYQKGDVVALFMENRPEFVAIWLGLGKLGVVTALVNTNLRSKPLAYVIKTANARGIIFGKELCQALADLKENSLQGETQLPADLFAFGALKGGHGIKYPECSLEAVELDTQLETVNASPPMVMNPPKPHDTLLYLYTSGTTGMPKAVIVTSSKFMSITVSFHCMSGIGDEILYACLPLHHGNSGLAGVGQGIFFANKIILRKKFSASNFWKDCADNGVTVAQYIGEVCRYLLSQPPNPHEKLHRVQVMIGNGLRPEIWTDCIKRFNIPQICEFYASTDGNCNMGNFDNREGAVGFLPVWAKKVFPVGLIRVDELTDSPIRDEKTGLCVRCKADEPGELVGKIVKHHALRDFRGYAGEHAGESTNKKILRDVFTHGDAYFRTGDSLVTDELGYFYFKDRVGDSFRWKGENVSCAEVEGIISTACDLNNSVVFGVKIPHTEGKAGMAVVSDPDKRFDQETFTHRIVKMLPPYAIPLFLRISPYIETTSTYKLKKLNFQQDGIDIAKISDPLYFYSHGNYIPLDAHLYEQIMHGKIRL